MGSILLLPEVMAEKGRVSNVAPALSPETRAVTHYRERQRFIGRAHVADAEARQAAATAPDGIRPRTELEAQLGRPLMGTEVQKRLAKLNPSLIFEQSVAFPERTCIYVRDARMEEGKRLVCAMLRGFAPEFSVVDPTTGREPARGWRTVLYKLMNERLITPAQVEATFGQPGRESARWQSLTS